MTTITEKIPECVNLFEFCMSRQDGENRDDWYRNKMTCADAYFKCVKQTFPQIENKKVSCEEKKKNDD